MTVAAYLESVAASGLQIPVEIVAVRFDDRTPHARRDVERAAGPSILWRETDRPGEPTLDGFMATGTAIHVECRSPMIEGARRLLADLLAKIREDGRLVEILTEYDSPDSISAKRLHFFGVVAEIVIR